MTHVFAVVGLGLACMAWFLVQQWTGKLPEEDECGGCSQCDSEPDEGPGGGRLNVLPPC
ncbi:MAG: hypothetical protein GY898_27875 [Proteobacteria bacterium]|nr:hypothetical protein [Pseudomonadota bacterium]